QVDRRMNDSAGGQDVRRFTQHSGFAGSHRTRDDDDLDAHVPMPRGQRIGRLFAATIEPGEGRCPPRPSLSQMRRVDNLHAAYRLVSRTVAAEPKLRSVESAFAWPSERRLEQAVDILRLRP